MQRKVAEYLPKSRWDRLSSPVAFIRCLPLLALVALLFSACTLPGMNPLPATNTPPPGLTLIAAPTETAGCYPEPDSAAARQAGQTRIATLLPGAAVLWYDGFGCTELSDGWRAEQVHPTTQISIQDSLLTVRAQKVDQVWDGLSRSDSNLVADQGILVLFQYEAGTTAPLFIYAGNWQTDSYLRVGLIINKDVENAWQVWQGFAFLSTPIDASLLRPDTPYYLMIRLSRDGQVIMWLWERDNPSNRASYQDRLPGLGASRPWTFQFQLQEGAIKIDEYFEFSFINP